MFAIEAIPSQKHFLALPNFHLLITKENGLSKGHILDFNLWVYSEKLNEDEALKEIFNHAQQITLHFIMEHFKNNNIDNLYKNSVKNSGPWEEFTKENNRTKIEMLKQSYQMAIDEPTKIREFLALQPTINVINFQNLDEDSFSKLREVLARIDSMKPELASEIIEKALAMVTSVYDLKRLDMKSLETTNIA